MDWLREKLAALTGATDQLHYLAIKWMVLVFLLPVALLVPAAFHLAALPLGPVLLFGPVWYLARKRSFSEKTDVLFHVLLFYMGVALLGMSVNSLRQQGVDLLGIGLMAGLGLFLVGKSALELKEYYGQRERS